MSRRPESATATRSLRGLWIIGTVVVVVGLALVVALAHGSSKKPQGAGLVSASLLHKITTIPASVYERVGTGTAVNAPKKISAPALKIGTKPEVLYIGAEYCPYCATERWPMVIALSRFGTFSKLKTTHSSSIDTFPNTATFSFHHATYSSPYLAFTGVELSTNQPQGSGYAPLDTLTSAQSDIFRTYTSPPYSTQVGGIPFVDFGGRYLVTAVSYDPGVLQGKGAIVIADELRDPTSSVSKGAVGEANLFTAAICNLTANRPAAVCGTTVISRLEPELR
jgi:hypothetical protein